MAGGRRKKYRGGTTSVLPLSGVEAAPLSYGGKKRRMMMGGTGNRGPAPSLQMLAGNAA
jgi:hypothetical protein